MMRQKSGGGGNCFVLCIYYTHKVYSIEHGYGVRQLFSLPTGDKRVFVRCDKLRM